MKKLLAVVLVLAMVLSASAVVFAEVSPTTVKTQETVKNADGTEVTTTETKNGSKEVATTAADGSKTVTVTLSAKDANTNAFTTSDVTATADEATAPVVKVTVPASASGGDSVVQFATKNNSNKVALKVKNADGTYSVVKKAAAGAEGPVATVKGTQEFIVVENSKTFKDTAGASWLQEAADFVSSRELMIGETADEFRPNEAIDVATMMTVLGRLDDKVSLEDSMGKTWENAGVAWAEKNGFSATGDMARNTMGKALYKYAGSPKVTEAQKNAVKAYADAAGMSDEDITAFAWLISQGIFEGVGNNKLDWQGTANRGQLGAIVQRYVNAIVK